MSTHRKMLNNLDEPQLQSLIQLIKTQSKETIVKWCLSYSEQHLLAIYSKSFPNDPRPQDALSAAQDWLTGRIKLQEAKIHILNCHAAARDAVDSPAAQAAARAIGQSASTVHMPAHSLGLALYGALAIAYDQLGMETVWTRYQRFAAEEYAKMEAALREIAIEDELNPAKIAWHC